MPDCLSRGGDKAKTYLLYYSCNMVERKIPEWARRERLQDLSWIQENMHVFWPAAWQQYQEQGRGAIVVDTTVQPEPEWGNPFVYLSQGEVEEAFDEDAQRMVQQYEPEQEIVIVLLKPEERVSTYRVQMGPPREGT